MTSPTTKSIIAASALALTVPITRIVPAMGAASPDRAPPASLSSPEEEARARINTAPRGDGADSGDDGNGDDGGDGDDGSES